MTRLLFVVVAVLVSIAPIGAARQDSMGLARELYATAAYDEALAMLDRLRSVSPAPATADARTIEQFRAYCLFALGRAADAEKAVEALVVLDPTWEIAATDAPPRIVALFSSVRGRALPGLVRDRFDAGKALHAAKKYDEAVATFTKLLALLDQPSVAKVSGRDLTDLRTVVGGFRDLSKAAAEQSLAAAAAAAPPPVTPAPVQTASNGAPGGLPAKPAEPPNDPVLPPSIITQQIPRPIGMAVPLSGEAIVIMDVLIDEMGKVERAAIRQSVNRAYEAQLLAASRAWRYTPATQAGKPVKYVKTIEITLSAR
jgi:TonB family protein